MRLTISALRYCAWPARVAIRSASVCAGESSSLAEVGG